MVDYQASSFQYRPGLSQSNAEMQRHAGMISAQQTQDQNAAQLAQLMEILFNPKPVAEQSPWLPKE